MDLLILGGDTFAINLDNVTNRTIIDDKFTLGVTDNNNDQWIIETINIVATQTYNIYTYYLNRSNYFYINSSSTYNFLQHPLGGGKYNNTMSVYVSVPIQGVIGDPEMFSYGGIKYKLPTNNNNYCYYDNWNLEQDIRDRIVVNVKTRHSKIPAKNIDESYNRYVYITYQELADKIVLSESHLMIDMNGLKIIDVDKIPNDVDLDKLLVKGFSRFNNSLDPYYVDTIDVPKMSLRRSINYNDDREYLTIYIETEENGVLKMVLFDKERELVLSNGFQRLMAASGGWGCLVDPKYGLETDKYSLENITDIILPENEFINRSDLMSKEDIQKIITDYKDYVEEIIGDYNVANDITIIYDKNGRPIDKLVNNIESVSSGSGMKVNYQSYILDNNGDKVLTNGREIGKVYTLEEYAQKTDTTVEQNNVKQEELRIKYRQMIADLCSGSIPMPIVTDKIFVFLLCPPHQGSTVLYKLLSTSPNISTLINSKVGNNENPIWTGEGQALLRQELFNGIIQVNMKETDLDETGKKQNKRSISRLDEDPNDTIIDFDCMFSIYGKYWDLNKQILCEKSPSFIRYAKQYEKYYSQFGETYFISMIRNPYAVSDLHYHADEWVKNAQYIKQFENELKNNLVIRYEDFTDKLEETSQKLIDFIPNLDTLNIDVTEVEGIFEERSEKITNKNVFRNIAWKNIVLQNYTDLMDHFGYSYLEQ